MTLDHARRLVGAAAIFVALGSLLGCAELPPDARVSRSEAQPVAQSQPAGTNTQNETCRYEANGAAGGGELAQGYDVFCGSWQQPSGRVFQAATAAEPGALAQLAQSSAWRAGMDERFTCGEPAATTLFGDSPAQIMSCTRRSGGWPQVALVADVGGKTYFVDGVPSAVPALQTVLAALSGRSVPTGSAASPPELSAAIAAHPFGSGDLDSYYTLMRLGTTANDAGDYGAAERAYRSALAIQERILGPNDPGLALPMMDFALQVSNQGHYAEADEDFARANSLLARSGDPLVKARYDLYVAEHEANRSRFDRAQASDGLAEQEFMDVIPQSLIDAARGGARTPQGRTASIGDSVLLGPDGQTAVSGLATSWSLKSVLDYRAGDYPQAKTATEQVRALLTASGLNPPGVVPRVVRLAALTDAGEGDYSTAVDRLSEAAGLFGKYSANVRPAAITWFLAGRTALASGDNAKALELFRQGAELAHSRHVALPESLVSDYLTVLDTAAAATGADTAKLTAEFFDAAQLIQGNVTGQVVAQAFARLSAGDPAARDLLRQMQDADLQLQQLYAQRDQATQLPAEQQDPAALAKLDADIVAVQEDRSKADSAAQAASPDYAKLVATDAPVDAVQHVLGPHEGLLTFIVGARRSFAVLVEPDGEKEYRIDMNAAQVVKAVAALRATIEPGENDTKLPVFDVAQAHGLYQTLLAPVATRLERLQRLVVVPSGALTALPLETLVTQDVPPVTDGNYKDVPFLLTKLTINYMPSPQTLVVLREHTRPSAGTQPYIGFGDFVPATPRQLAVSFPPDRCAADYQGLSALPPLPGTRKEITTVGTSIFHVPPQDIVLGADFTKANLEGMDLTKFRIVHLATHAFLPTELHCRTEPLIAVSEPPGATDAGPAFIGLSDILSLKLDADLVLLSACNTAGPGGSSQEAGDSLSGLAKAFFFAGARGLLVTHWALEDNAGPLLTALSLNPSGGSADSAFDLRQAKLTMIQKVGARPGAGNAFFTHPFAWAPFVLVGDGIRPAGAAAAAVNGGPGPRG